MPSSPPQRVEVTVPLRAEFGATLRVVTASLATDLGFTVDEIDDLRLAVNEVFGTLLGDDADGRTARARFTLGAQSLEIALAAGDGRAVELDELATTILRSVVDEWTSDGRQVVVSKHAREAHAGTTH